jgi:hypothetical protein
MTQAYNLAILANAVNTSGQLNVGTNATGTLPLANGGTGTTNTVNSVVAGSGISVSTSGTQVTVSTTGAGGVTSLNGQTGAITTTNLDSIGAYLFLVNNTTSNFLTGSTTSGSNLRYPNSVGSYGPNDFNSGGNGIPRNNGNSNGGTFGQVLSGNVGNGGDARNTTTVSGTWRCLTPVGGRANDGYCGDNNSTQQRFSYSPWVRIS